MYSKLGLDQIAISPYIRDEYLIQKNIIIIKIIIIKDKGITELRYLYTSKSNSYDPVFALNLLEQIHYYFFFFEPFLTLSYHSLKSFSKMAEENMIILKGMEDWTDWIKTIKVIADGLEIWEYMDPEVEPADVPRLTRPAKPTGESVDSGDLEIFKYDLKSWSEKKSALKKIPEKIIQTIDKSCFNFIEDHSTPYTMLRDLRQKLKPNDNLYKNILLKKWKSLQRYPTRQDLENWINEYDTCYQKLTKINYFSGSTSNAVEEFVDILPHTEFKSWAGQQIEGGEDLEMRAILQKFRESVVRAKAKSGFKPEGKMAFANPKFQGISTDGKEERLRSTPNVQCEACGYNGHDLEGCFIIFPEKRPSNWKNNPEKERKIFEKIRNDPLLADRIKELRKTEKKSQISAHAVIKPVTLTDRAAYSTSEYELRDSVLLDSAASDHVTNDLKRLTSYRPVEGEFVWSGNTKVPILGYGTMRAYGTHPITLLQVELELENTVYIPTFHTSLISMKKLRNRGFTWDQDIDCLKNSKGIVCEVLDKYDLYVIEYNKPKPTSTFFQTLEKKPVQKSEIRTTLKLPKLNDLLDSIDIESDDDEYETIEHQEPESEPSTESRKQGESDGPLIGIPTPELTPEPSTLSFPLPSKPIHQQDETGTVEKELNEPTTENRSNRAPRATEISADLDEKLIISGSRSRRRRDAHHFAVQDPTQFIGFRSAFALGLERPEKKIHRDDMPTSSRNWKEFNNHKYRERYLQTREIEWTELLKRETFEEVTIPPETKRVGKD